MRKRLLLCLACVAALLLVVDLAVPKDRINRVGFEDLQVGMSQEEVELVLGGPPGGYYSGPTELTGDYADLGHVPPTTKWDTATQWFGQEGRIAIEFDEDGRLEGAEFYGMRPRSESLPVKIRRWLGL